MHLAIPIAALLRSRCLKAKVSEIRQNFGGSRRVIIGPTSRDDMAQLFEEEHQRWAMKEYARTDNPGAARSAAFGAKRARAMGGARRV